jgi:hypothetical protein
MSFSSACPGKEQPGVWIEPGALYPFTCIGRLDRAIKGIRLKDEYGISRGKPSHGDMTTSRTDK